MLLVVPAELPTADVVVAVPDDDEDRVVIFVDPRVPFEVSAETIARVARAIRRPGGRLAQLSTVLPGPAYPIAAT